MNLRWDERTRKILHVVRSCSDGASVWLVGGAVRDSLLGIPLKDLDFVTRADSVRLGKAVQKQLNAVAFTLDDDRKMVRVILNRGKEDQVNLDFVLLMGETIEEDLRQRDYTIDAMAVELDNLDEVIDPLGGKLDLKDRLLRHCQPGTVFADPLRALRGARLIKNFGLTPDLLTEEEIKLTSKALVKISTERTRDELFKLIALGDVADTLFLLNRLELLEPIFPEIEQLRQLNAVGQHVHNLWDHTLQTIRYLESLINCLSCSQKAIQNDSYLDEAYACLTPYRNALNRHLNEPLQGGRPRRHLLLLAAIYHDVGKPATMASSEDGTITFPEHGAASAKAASNFAQLYLLGNEESAYLQKVVGGHMRVAASAIPHGKITKLAIYNFYQPLGSAGVDVCLHTLADLYAARENKLDHQLWQLALQRVSILLEAWFDRYDELVDPPRILNGFDLQKELGLPPGPHIGQLLEVIRSRQVEGGLSTYEEALAYARQSLNQ